MGDLTFTGIKAMENESGLVHIVEATVSDGKTSKLCHVEFIDMPVLDGEGNLRMDAVGGMLRDKFYEPVFVPKPVDPKEVPPDIEPIEAEPVAIDADYLAARKAKLITVKAQITSLGTKPLVIKDAAADLTAIEAKEIEEVG